MGWTRLAVIVSGVVAVVLGVIFVWRETTFATPLIPTTYWRRRNFMFPMATKGFTSFAYFGGFFLFPLLMEQVYGYSVSQVGFISVARPLLFAISAPIAGYMTVRTGERTATLFGTASLFVSMVLFATLRASSGLSSCVVALALSGLGMGVSHAGHLVDHVERAGRVRIRRHERGAAAGHPSGGGGGHPGRADHSGVDRQELGARHRAPEHGAVAQLQRALLGRRVRGRRWPSCARCSSAPCRARRAAAQLAADAA